MCGCMFTKNVLSYLAECVTYVCDYGEWGEGSYTCCTTQYNQHHSSSILKWGLMKHHVQALEEELSEILAGPNWFNNETKFRMRAMRKAPNGENSSNLAQPYFADIITRYKDPLYTPQHIIANYHETLASYICLCEVYCMQVHTKLQPQHIHGTHIQNKECKFQSVSPYKEKYSETKTAGKPYEIFLAVGFDGNETLLERAVAKGVVKLYHKNGIQWAMSMQEAAVRKTGWKEGTEGHGAKRQVEEVDIDTMAKLLRNRTRLSTPDW